MKDTWSVAILTDYGCCETCHPLVVGVDRATAKSVYRHFHKLCHYDDYRQTGDYVMMVSQDFCLNHEDFEKETTFEGLMYDENDLKFEEDIFTPSEEDLREWQMASCGLV